MEALIDHNPSYIELERNKELIFVGISPPPMNPSFQMEFLLILFVFFYISTNRKPPKTSSPLTRGKQGNHLCVISKHLTVW